MSEPKKLRLTPAQLATILVFDAQIAQLLGGANQLHWAGCKEEAETLNQARLRLEESLETYKRSWDSSIVLATAAPVTPNLVRAP